MCHLETHCQMKKYECDICGKQVSQLMALKRHKSVRHSRIQSKLNVVKRRAIEEESTSDSITSNTNCTSDSDKTYHCEHCPATKNSSLQMQRQCNKFHPDNSNNIVKNQCHICLSKMSKGSLPRQMRTHTKERPFKCDKCGNKYRQKKDLVRHVKAKHEKHKKNKMWEGIQKCRDT